VLNLVGADLRVSIPAAGALVTAYAPGLGIGEPIDRADGWNLVAGVPLHRPRSGPAIRPRHYGEVSSLPAYPRKLSVGLLHVEVCDHCCGRLMPLLYLS
jgi:hypothetical protein